MKLPLLLIPVIGLCAAGCQTGTFKYSLHPRYKALYTEITVYRAAPGFAEDSIPLELAQLKFATLKKQRNRQVFRVEGSTITVEIRADREGDGAFLGEVVCSWDSGLGEPWSEMQKLNRRTDGRWTLDMGLNTQTDQHLLLAIEMEGDPFYEMQRQKPGRGFGSH